MIPINSHKRLHPENDHMMDTRQGLAFLFGFGQKFFPEFSDEEPKARLGRNTSKWIASECAVIQAQSPR
jgi:hypothetical protein